MLAVTPALVSSRKVTARFETVSELAREVREQGGTVGVGLAGSPRGSDSKKAPLVGPPDPPPYSYAQVKLTNPMAGCPSLITIRRRDTRSELPPGAAENVGMVITAVRSFCTAAAVPGPLETTCRTG
jgi:hypothetical protein